MFEYGETFHQNKWKEKLSRGVENPESEPGGEREWQRRWTGIDRLSRSSQSLCHQIESIKSMVESIGLKSSRSSAATSTWVNHKMAKWSTLHLIVLEVFRSIWERGSLGLTSRLRTDIVYSSWYYGGTHWFVATYYWISSDVMLSVKRWRESKFTCLRL